MTAVIPKFEKVKKANGEIENFDREKLLESVKRSIIDVSDSDLGQSEKTVNEVIQILNDKFVINQDYVPTSYDIREAVSIVFMKNNQFKAAQAYITYKHGPKFFLKSPKGVTKIIKRNGSLVDFDLNRIKSAVLKAGEATSGFGEIVAEDITNKVYETLNKIYDQVIPNIEQIQDIIEMEIMRFGYPDVAKAYILYRLEHQKMRERQLEILGGMVTDINFNESALTVISKRYLVRDEDGNIIESPEEMFRRVAKAIAEVENHYDKDSKFIKDLEENFYQIMTNFEFSPGGRTLANAGGPTRLVSNCIVLHIEDDMGHIFDTLKDASLLQQAGSGLGFPIHFLRPAGTIAKRTRGVASGPISFLKVYNKAFGVIKQQGRHGANMAIMRVDHPDILEFIHCKEKEGELNNFNISVGLTNEFMEAVRANDSNPWMCRFAGKETKPRRIIRDSHDMVLEIREETITAKELFHEIVNAAWQNGEPGCVFSDRANETNPLPGLGSIEACNPCGEQFLHDGDVCNLGSINLAQFVKNGEIDFDRLKHVTRLAVRFLDNVVDLTDFPVERVSRVFKSNRRVGLGIMGFGDMLYQLKLGYNTQEGRDVAEKVMSFINNTAHATSQELAEEKGVFPNIEKSIYKDMGIKMRNAALTTIAPTGTTSMIFNCSSGVEPCFALAFHRKGILGSRDMQLFYTNRYLEEELKSRGLYINEILEKIEEFGSIQDIQEIPDEIKKVFVTSMDISAEDHIKMQSAFQKYVDNSISKTINFPNSATKEDVMSGYLLAWELGCKGCTVYRDGSREIQVLNLNKKTENKKEETQTKEIAEDILSFQKTKKDVIRDGICPECGSAIEIVEGCYICKECGFSACSL